MTQTPLHEFIQSIREQIAQDDVGLALDRLQNYLCASAPKLRNEVILHQSRYHRLRRQERVGIIAPQAAQVGRTQIANALLALLDELPSKIGEDMAPSPASVRVAGSPAIPDEVRLEKILGVNNLKQIAWLEQGLQVADSVCRILTRGGFGTGFQIAPGLIMTNNHVIPNSDAISGSFVEFNYQLPFGSKRPDPCRYELDTDKARFHSSRDLDYTIVGVKPDSQKPPLESWGYTSLNSDADPVPGEHVTIIQHPGGGPKQIVLTANQVVGSWEHRLHYTTDTMPGSSGSPVFNDLWQVIAIHHAGGRLQVNAKGDARFINEGVLMSAIRPDMGSLWPR
jgi:V8-like Glu-specific endopeptidase